MNSVIGFSQRVKLDWLERTAHHALMGASRAVIQADLQDYLRDRLSVDGSAERGNREKTISILLKTWVTVPIALQPLRDEALDHLRRLPTRERLPLHWGMSMAVYPFFGSVAETAGRLLGLQGSVGAAHVQRRVAEALGERDTVHRATRRVLRSFIDWGVLDQTDAKGVYGPTPTRPVGDPALAAWLVEAALHAGSPPSAPLRSLMSSPALFPFALEPVSPRLLAHNPRLEIYRQGLDEDMVALR